MAVTRRLDADLPTHAEMELLLAACSRRAPTGVRNAALIALAWRCGLRSGELVTLNIKDVYLEERRVTVQRGKGGRRRVVGLDAGTAAMLERWLAARRKLHIRPSAPLFCTLAGNGLDTSYLRHLFKRLARKAGVARRIHPHACRHRFAVDLIQEGADLPTVQQLLCHSSAATTSIYLSRIGASSSARNVSAASPRGERTDADARWALAAGPARLRRDDRDRLGLVVV